MNTSSFWGCHTAWYGDIGDSFKFMCFRVLMPKYRNTFEMSYIINKLQTYIWLLLCLVLRRIAL